ncbi:MAG: hypothetical protein AABW48_00850 [Nanoarchaeota archaeon]
MDYRKPKSLQEMTLAELCWEAEQELRQAQQNLQASWNLVKEARKELYQPKDIYNQ